MDSFKQLADAFSTAFLGAKTRKIETSYLFRIKQGKSEPLKEYLDRFRKAVVQVKSCSDNTLIHAFREGIKDRRLVWAIAYDVPPTFTHLRGIARKHVEAEEYIRGRGLVPGELSRPIGKKPNKDGAVQVISEKGKAISKAEANLGSNTPVGRFRQYTTS
ncbi:hypothetical protein TIFTF001_037854 [Ficus carica]|uniref:Retrotransposon gag domain-containing protein n=1 Tax=Ficus carica TaxID=3494 RepID=A0AA88E7S3_FICCA|nr:hypothetical protein TIFTF001_037854 [Ficus carica]